MKTRMKVCFLLLSACVCVSAHADDARVHQLELDVAQLRREMMAQARRIDELERQNRGGRDSAVTNPLPAPAQTLWLVAANWERLRPGMPESEAVKVLGTPTSVREGSSPQRRTLFYALEVAPDAYLAGSIEIDDGRVSEVKKPVLR
jgi:hypothetical protein